ncbi:biotin/lipoyl-binding carrier protein [Saccharopolyspora sp. K220]|uniref:biotin/lipoyl-binding carrier protein n=1 Tax=Saccharopolyspora soli TaxID=2926618 RepID=UPI001F5A6C9F|nr:biotin/lipoyl-binding carrier protein [Saccharopolyspora soli]MCI2417374.1 biotin/lipoyl-binding carrier protein [Saccharopolyspora soli]
MTEIVADITANVWKVVVSTGESVQPGDTVAILESMKMEIPVVAEEPGTVSEIKVTEGGTVDEGDVIAILTA